jgi:hypothetical protein
VFLQNPTVIKDENEFENLCLKFISFLSRQRENNYKAYFELKNLLYKTLSLSLYFKNVAKILSKKIEKQMDEDVEAKKENSQENRLDNMKSDLLYDN